MSLKLALLLNVVLTPRVAYPEVKVKLRDLMRVVGIVAPLPLFIEPQGLMGTGDLCRVPPAAVRHGKGSRQRSGTVWGL